MLSVVLLLLTLPVAAALVCLRAPLPLARAATAVCGVACFGLVLALVPATAHRELLYLTFLRVDALSTVFLIATGFLYAAVAVYSVGYLAHGGHGQDSARYSRRFWLGLNLFAWAMLAAPLMSSLALLWVAIEITTVVSALLVAIEDTDGAAEAAWKYVLIGSAGLGLALLATIFAYYAGAQVLGQSYDLAFAPLLHAAPRLPHTPVQLAFVLAVLGFGTKMGLVPVHTWLPDAHSEAPTPVSALLSGSLLAVSFYAILRYYQVAAAALGPRFPRDVLLVFGVASLLLAALYLFGQRDIKRLLAYSSVEHMGILAIGVSFGAPIALAGVLLHVLAHAAAKGNAFMGAGVIVTKFGTKRITAGAGGTGRGGGAGRRDGDVAGRPGHGPVSAIRGVLDALPWSGPLFLFSILALGAMPPFGIFRSEFEIVAGGFATSSDVAAAILIIGVTVAFFGLAASTTPMLMLPRILVRRAVAEPEPVLAAAVAGPPAPVAGPTGGRGDLGGGGPDEGGPDGDGPDGDGRDGDGLAWSPEPARGEPSAWMVVPVVAGALALVVLGVHPPAELTELLARAVRELGGAA
jgi:hydrogenase-4 component F